MCMPRGLLVVMGHDASHSFSHGGRKNVVYFILFMSHICNFNFSSSNVF